MTAQELNEYMYGLEAEAMASPEFETGMFVEAFDLDGFTYLGYGRVVRMDWDSDYCRHGYDVLVFGRGKVVKNLPPYCLTRIVSSGFVTKVK